MKLYDLQVNHLTNPIGFQMENVTFSWKVKEAKGKKQKDARIIIAEDADFEKIVTDTGFCGDLRSIGSRVEMGLEPCTRYFWQVTVRTDVDGEEETSETAFFETAKRELSWSAKWITCDSGDYKAEVSSRTKRHPIFEKKVSKKEKVAKARLYDLVCMKHTGYHREKNLQIICWIMRNTGLERSI